MLTDAGADHTLVEKNKRRLSKDTAEVMAAAMGREDTAAYLKSLGTTVYAMHALAKMKKGIGGASDGTTDK